MKTIGEDIIEQGKNVKKAQNKIEQALKLMTEAEQLVPVNMPYAKWTNTLGEIESKCFEIRSRIHNWVEVYFDAITSPEISDSHKKDLIERVKELMSNSEPK